MFDKSKSSCIILIVMLFFIINGVFVSVLLAQHKQELEITIEGISSGDKTMHFNNGEELRKQHKFTKAIKEYQQVITPGNSCGKEAKALYNIGLCYTWIVKKDEAAAVFREILATYPDSSEVIAYSKYCLSWVDVQNNNFKPAIERLQKTLDEKLYQDEKFCSQAQFQIGRIYFSFIHDYDKAKEAFLILLEKYPDSEITNHPFLEGLKK